MTISSTTRIAGPFTGNDVAFVFPFTFKVFSAADLYVASGLISSGAQSTLALNTDYTVALNANQNSNPGGSVILTLPLATGSRLTVSSSVANLQPTELINQGGFYPEVLTASLDRATIQVQQLQGSVDLSLQFPITDPSMSNILPSAEVRAGKVLGFDSSGVPQAVVPSGGGSGGAMYQTECVFTGSQTIIVTHGLGNLTPVIEVTSKSGAQFFLTATPIDVNSYSFTSPASMDVYLTFTSGGTAPSSGAPSITSQPANDSVTSGATATFTSTASGTPTPTVQWQLSTDSGATFANISGATSTTLTITGTTSGMNGYKYRAVFTNSLGTATSASATLGVAAIPASGMNFPMDEGGTASVFIDTIAGNNATLTAPVSWGTLSGVTGPVPTFNATQYAVAANDVVSNFDQGQPFTLEIWFQLAPSQLTTFDMLFCAAKPDKTGYFMLYAPNSLAFHMGDSGATHAVDMGVTFSAVANTTYYAAMTSDGSGTAAGVKIYLNGALGTPTIVQDNLGTNSVLSGLPARLGADGSGGSPHSGALWGARLTKSVLSAGTIATNYTSGRVVPSGSPAIITQPANDSVTSGATATFTSTASGTPTPTVQWQLSTDSGVTFANISGATSTTLTITGTTLGMNGYKYRAVFTNSVGTATSASATLGVAAPASGMHFPMDEGGTASVFIDTIGGDNATLTAPVSWGTLSGVTGPVPTFNATQYAVAANDVVSNFDQGQAFTLEIWFQLAPSQLTTYDMLFSAAKADRTGYFLFQGPGQFIFVLGGPGATNAITIATNLTVAANSTYYLAVTYAGTGLASGTIMYVNGSPATISSTQDNLGATSILSGLPARLGGDGSGGSLHSGALWSARLTKSVLSAGTIATNYTSGVR